MIRSSLLNRSLTGLSKSFSYSVVSRESSKPGFVQSLLHGAPDDQEGVYAKTLQHSKLVGRGKNHHELIIHKVHPSKTDEYKKLAEAYFKTLTPGPTEPTTIRPVLMGSWECILGELDTFYHIVRHPSLTDVLPLSTSSTAHQALLPLLASRQSSLLQEFAFSPAHDNPTMDQKSAKAEGGIFELRSYQLKPGTMLEWEGAWKRGIEARRKFVIPMGAWFSQVGRLHVVHHMWQFKDMQERKEVREKAWAISGWSDTVTQTVKLAQGMSSQIMRPMSWSPIK
ncbi:NIPSNAP1 protein [Phaffia rhodozyma]|uniref:NIPSNAP1 protein n=1 Tax=Phaffia rhodozyma TaxID=264483 RepID=A0A0F7SQ27_PHARH|nr:NIPSNAP1 protein [Phaffia rhodozyma]